MMNNPPSISYFVMMGDSLSDRGTMDHRRLLNLIPMKWLSGLAHKSPEGRFTNGLTWLDDVSALVAEQFTINTLEGYGFEDKNFLDATDVADGILTHDRTIHLGDHTLSDKPLCQRVGGKQKALYAITPSPQTRAGTGLDQLDVALREAHHDAIDTQHATATDIADAVIAHDISVSDYVRNGYNLSNDLYVRYHGLAIVRCYDEGGLTAQDYAGKLSSSVARFFSRLILSTLAKKREKLLAYDKRYGITNAQKQLTLVVEWSGANDLITVNAQPSLLEATRAVQERIENVRLLITQGYRHFVLFELPDLSLTPRFQRRSTEAQAQAKACCEAFNQALRTELAQLQQQHADCVMTVFAINEKSTLR